MFPDEFGATSFLSFIAIQQCRHPEDFIVNRIPLFLDMRLLKPYVANITRSLRQSHPHPDHATFGWNRLERFQPYIVLVDNLEIGNDVQKECLILIHKILPRARFIVAVKSVLSGLATLVPGELPFATEWLSIQPFNRARIRELVRNYKLPPQFVEDRVVEELGARFAGLSVPLAGPQIAMYLLVLSSQARFAPINASTIIELFVEQLLEKPNLKDIFRVAVDYSEKADLLGMVAEHFIRKQIAVISYEEMYSVVSTYYKKIGIERNVQSIIQYFIQVGVFDPVATDLTFRYNILISFFTAYRMQQSDEFREYILDFERYTSFLHEIDIYCGLNRGDKQILERIASYFENINDLARGELAALMDQDAIAAMELPKKKDFQTFVTELTRTMTEEPDRKFADQGMDRRTTFAQRLQRPALKNILLRWIFAMRAYSVCVKNLEVIDKELKERHLSRVLDAWASAVALAITVTSICFKEGVVAFAGIKIRLDGFKLIDGRLLHFLLTNIPKLVSLYAKNDLASEKLDQQMRGLSGKQKLVSDFLRVGIMADLKSKEFIAEVRKYMERSSESAFMTEAMMWKLRDVYLRYGFSRFEENDFKRIIAEADADLQGLKGDKRSRRIAEVLQEVQRKRLIADMRQ